MSISYEKLYCVQSTGKYLRYYKSKEEDCGVCPCKKLHKEIEVTQNYKRKLLPVICAKSDQIRKF